MPVQMFPDKNIGTGRQAQHDLLALLTLSLSKGRVSHKIVSDQFPNNFSDFFTNKKNTARKLTILSHPE
jgi:hypothetical protein